MQGVVMMDDPEIRIGNEVKIYNQNLIFTVTDEFFDEYSNKYYSLIHCYDKTSDYAAGVIEVKKVNAKACKIWLF